MPSRLFRVHGEFCATHPWEVIVATLTLAACMLSVDHQHPAQFNTKPNLRACASCKNSEIEYNAADVIVMTLIRCLAVLYSYYQFCNLQKLGSRYILGIAGLFTVFSSFVFTSTVLKLLPIDMSDLKDALFFFLLLIDLSKAAMLAQSALSSSNQEEVRNNIARGMAKLGPTITLDTIVETLVIGVGTLSGVHRLEMLSYFACLSVIVNYIIFMTFYPACLSLVLELSRTTGYSKYQGSFIRRALGKEDEDHKSNPVVQRVKLIMSVGLMLVHARSRWPFKENEVDTIRPLVVVDHPLNGTSEHSTIHEYIMKWVTVSSDHIVILILLLALVVKFIFFESRDEQIQVRVHTSRRKMPYVHLNGATSAQRTATGESRNKEVQTENRNESRVKSDSADADTAPERLDDPTSESSRPLDECLAVYNDTNLGGTALNDEEVILLVNNRHIPAYQIEKAVDDPVRGVGIRRKILAREGHIADAVVDLPYKNYDYKKVMGACCENVIGYVPIPVGYAGPLHLDGRDIYVPMATTEGCLVASTNRGCRALFSCGVTSRLVNDGMTRGPVVRFPSIAKASEAMAWMKDTENFEELKKEFDSSSRFARLSSLLIKIAGRHLFVRFVAKTGDAMGMNMISKGTELSLLYVQKHFPEMEILSVSGNFCTDKKPAAVNWIEGRGKSVVCEAIIPGEIVTKVLKTTVYGLVDVNNSKNMIGSAVAGSIGGFNAHAANIVTAIYIATGQDPAQNVSSSNCMTLMEPWGENGEDLYISCTMPSIEIGTVGGGTVLPAQGSCLEMLGVRGAHPDTPGENASQLARIVCSTVLAGELSLMSALTAGHLVKSHMRHNRSTTTAPPDTLSQYIPACKDS